MSAGGSEGTGRYTVRIDDPKLGAALEEAEEEHGSKSEAVRSALRDSLLGAGGDNVSDSNGQKVPQKAVEGHRKLVEYTGVGGRLELATAESILANHLNIKKEAVRKVVIQPLKRENVIALHQGIHHVSIVVGTLDDEPINVEREVTDASETEAVTDVDEASDRLDELTAADTGVADGE